jgi:hypothetical protein
MKEPVRNENKPARYESQGAETVDSIDLYHEFLGTTPDFLNTCYTS